MRYASKEFPILVFIGPSSSGKSTIAEWLQQQSLVDLNPTYTTRPIRTTDEIHTTHVFVSDSEFDDLLRSGRFLRTERLFNLPFRYGLTKIVQPQDKAVPLILLRRSEERRVGKECRS